MALININKRGISLLFVMILLSICWTFVRFILVAWHRDPDYRSKLSKMSSAELKWWQKRVIYQIYPRSFQDSDGDGTGDLKGILSRLDYIQFLKVGAIWISPFYKSPMRDFGYDVADFKQVDPIFGEMADFDRLVQECHYRDIKMIIDFVPNHTSNESVWFQKSRSAQPGDRYRDYYVWNPGIALSNGTRVPPNNWQSHFGGSSWTWDEVREEFYYHAFLSSQPDLNYRNSDVLQEIDEVLEFWLAKGVDGFRIDALTTLFEVENVKLNNPVRKKKNHFVKDLFKNTENLPDIFSVVRRWRRILDKWEGIHSSAKFLIAETSRISAEQKVLYYKEGAVPFYFNLINAKKQCGATAECFREIINKGTLNSSLDRWPSFVIGNHDNSRVADRMGDDYVDAMNLLLLTLPGTPTTYYGEELGIHGGDYSGLTPKDPYAFISGLKEKSRDPERNPMQWNSSVNAGFTFSSKPWLPITENTEWRTCNVEEQKKFPESHLSIYKDLVYLGQNPAFQNAEISNLKTTGEVLSYVRNNTQDAFLIAINFGKSDTTVNIETGYSEGIVVMATDRNNLQAKVQLRKLMIDSAEGFVIHLLTN